ncbi:protein kinase [Planctomycetota bacterium]|nr:protein kinase [Planctomycetota bacterium]
MNESEFKKPHLSPLNPGDRVGPYTIVEQIGSGGSSIVFKAKDTLLNHFVAVKHIMLDPATDDEHLRHRVQQEIAIHKKVTADFPNYLVKMLDFIDDPRGIFIVMEYIDGPSLEQILMMSPAPMPLRQALGIIAGTAVALNHIHQKGIIHRDLKPANIIMPRTGGLKLTDFGLATIIAEQETMSLGSARYMAPEMFEDANADIRSDLYSLGLISYECIIGRTNFEIAFRSILRDKRNQALRWMKWHTNPRAQAASINQFMPDLDPKVNEFIGRLMAKDSDQRVPTTTDLVNAIRVHFVDLQIPTSEFDAQATSNINQTVSSAQDTAPLPRFSKSFKITALIALIILLSGAGTGLVLYSKKQSEYKRQVRIAEEQLLNAKDHFKDGDYEQALVSYNNVTDVWSKETKWGRVAETGSELAKGQLAMQEAKFDEAIAYFKQAAAIKNRDTHQIELLISEAEQRRDFHQAVTRIEQDITELRLIQAEATLANWRKLQLTQEEAEKIGELEVRLSDQRFQVEVDRIIKKAEAMVARGQREAAIRELNIAIKRMESTQLRQKYEHLIANATYEMSIAEAQTAEADNKYGLAVKHYLKAYEIKKSDSLKEKLSDLQSRAELEKGLKHLREGDVNRARIALLSSLGYKENPAAKEALKQIDDADRYELFMAAGQEAFESGNYEAALNHFKSAIDIESTIDANDNYREASMRYYIEECNKSIDSYDMERANQMLAKAEAIDSGHPYLDTAREQFIITKEYLKHLQKGDESRKQSRFAEAKRSYRRAMKIINSSEVKERLQDIEYEHLLAKARAFLAVGDKKNALAIIEVALEIRESSELTALYQEALKE